MKKLITAAIAAILMPIVLACGASAGEKVPHGGEIVFTKPLKAVLFSHKIHADKLELGCDLCHANNFEMAALKAQEKSDFTMASLAEGKYCGSCHNGTMAFSSNTRCASCHVGVKGS